MLSTDRLLCFVKVRIVKKEEAFLRLPPFFLCGHRFRAAPRGVRYDLKHPLIGASVPQALLGHLFLFNERPVHQHVDVTQQGRRLHFVEYASRPRPDRFLGEPGLDGSQELHKRRLVLRLKRVAPQERKPRHVGIVERLENRRRRFVRKGLSCRKIPAFLIKSPLAVHGATRHKERHPNTRAVGGVVLRKTDVVHFSNKTYILTRLRISAIFPSFMRVCPFTLL